MLKNYKTNWFLTKKRFFGLTFTDSNRFKIRPRMDPALIWIALRHLGSWPSLTWWRWTGGKTPCSTPMRWTRRRRRRTSLATPTAATTASPEWTSGRKTTTAGRQSNRTHFDLSFGLKNYLRFHFDSLTFLNHLFLKLFLSVGNLKLKLKVVFFKPKLNL